MNGERERTKSIDHVINGTVKKEVNDLIPGYSRQLTIFLQLLKETAIKYGEYFNLKWEDIDLVSNVIRIVAEKGSEPRVFKISNTLATMLSSLPKTSPEEKVFKYKNLFYLRETFIKQRKKTAHRLGNPRLLQIHFHTFRHWKATMLYRQTKDILYVMQFLGHKNLIENGFEYVTDMDNYKLFRKRK